MSWATTPEESACKIFTTMRKELSGSQKQRKRVDKLHSNRIETRDAEPRCTNWLLCNYRNERICTGEEDWSAREDLLIGGRPSSSSVAPLPIDWLTDLLINRYVWDSWIPFDRCVNMERLEGREMQRKRRRFQVVHSSYADAGHMGTKRPRADMKIRR